MIARLQQAWSTFLLLAALGLSALAAGHLGAGAGLLAGVLLLGLATAGPLLTSFLLLPALQRGDPASRLGAAGLLRAALGEWVVVTRVFLWRQPWGWRRHPDLLPAAPLAPGRHGVVFIHGFVCNRGLWNPWLAALRREGRAFAAVNLEPAFGSIDDYVPIIDAAVRRVAQATGRPPVLVCHSMGGLAARAWLRRTGADARIAQVVTIGTPHHGTALAHEGPAVNGRQMRRDSRWLQRLAEDESAERHGRFVCYWSNADNIVLPATTATLVGADNRFVPGVGHVALVEAAVVRDGVRALLQELDRRAAV